MRGVSKKTVLVGNGGSCLNAGCCSVTISPFSVLLMEALVAWALWGRLWKNPGTQGVSKVKILPVFPSGCGICGEACGLFLTSFYNNNTTHHVSHAQTPKNQCRDFFFPGHLFHFLEMEQLSLYTFLLTFRSTRSPSRAMMHQECSVPPPLYGVLTLAVLSTGSVLSLLPHIHIFSPFRIQMPAPPRSPPYAPQGLWTLTSFCSYDSYLHLFQHLSFLSLQQGSLNTHLIYPTIFVPLEGAVSFASDI